MENIKRNYVFLTLFPLSVILFFIDMKSGIIVYVLSFIAVLTSKQIVGQITKQEKKYAKDKEFYDAVEKYNNEIFDKHDFK
ncbi:MAG: hypothetical protein REI64_03140 [Pedobacter sp.]|uniref:hypothetical protein n=1 Tax=Pedobacter sp. TaxID=1411316 RepID=UPI00280972AC|nr:hypothetical protein [Pedobacter sp.]MDQ8003767.1 hypothetical protein [Pedobacter sp.]